METKYYQAKTYELQIINEGGCVVSDLSETHTDFMAALKAYKKRRLRKSDYAKAFNLHHLENRPVETAGVEKALVVCFEDAEGNDCEIQLLAEFI